METAENQKKIDENKFSLKKKLSILGILVLLIGAVIANSQIDDFPLLEILLGISGMVIILLCFVYFMDQNKKFNLFKKEAESEDRLPRSFPVDEIKSIIKEMVEDPEKYANHIREWGPMNSREVGKNLIYTFEIELEYSDDNFKEGIFVIVNSHYPREIISFVANSLSDAKKNYYINQSSKNPKDDPSEKIVEEENPLLGTRRRTIEKKPAEKKEKEKKTSESDLG